MNVFDLYAKISLDTSSYEDGVDKAKKSSDTLSDALQDTAEYSETLKNKVAVLSEQYKSALGNVENLSKQFNESVEKTGAASEESQKLAGQLEEAEKQAGQLKNQLDQYSDSADDAAGKTSGFAEILQSTSAIMTSAAATAITAFAAASVKVGMEFDQQISQVAATMGKTTEEIANLRDFALEMGSTTSFSATQAAEALNYMALAGYSAEESMSALPNVLNLAAAGGMELAEASDMVTDAQSALDLSMEQSVELVDKMSAAASNSNTSVSQLGSAILTVGGTAKQLKGGTTELATALGILADNGIKAAEGGTALRNIINTLTAPSTTAAKKLEELGVSAYDADQNLRGLNEVFADLSAALSNLTAQERSQALRDIFNVTDFKSAEALLANATDRFDELSAAIDGAAGAAATMADTQLDNLSGKMTIIGSSIEGLQIAVSDALTPALEKIADVGITAFSWAGDVVKDNPELVQALAGAAAGVTTLAGVVAGYTIVTTAAKKVQEAFNTTITGASALAFTAIAAAIGALVAVVASYKTEADEAREATDALISSIESSKSAYESSATAAQTDAEEISILKDMLYEQMEAADGSAESNSRISEIVDQLNQKVPELNLAYNAQTNELNLTNEQLERYIQNQVTAAQRTLLIQRLAETKTQLAQVREELTKQKAAYDAMDKSSYALRQGMEVTTVKMGELSSEAKKAANSISDLESESDALEKTVNELTDALNDLNNENKGLGAMFKDVAGQAGEQTDATDALTDASDALTSTVNSLSSAESTLADALAEQAENGNLSYNTINDLIDSGYALALQIDAETGAVSVNAAAYVELTNAKIDEQIASNAAKMEALGAESVNWSEADSALAAASAYLAKAQAKNASDSDKEIAELAAENAAWVQLKNSILSAATARYSSGGGGGGGGGSSKAKTQAEQDLETYKEILATMDHERAMGELKDEAYYTRLAGLREQYLTDDSNLSEYRKNLEAVHKYEEDDKKQKEETAKQEAEDKKEALNEIEKAMISSAENQIKIQNYTTREQLTMWQDLLTKVEKDGDQYKDIESKIFDARIAIRDEFYDSVKTINSNIDALESNYASELENRVQEIYGAYGIFEEIPERQEVSGEKLMSNLQGQIERIQEFYDGLQELEERGVSQTMLDEIRKLGPDYVDSLNAILSLSDDKLSEYSGMFSEKQELANKYAVDGLEELRQQTDEKIQEQLDSIKALYDETTPLIGEAFTDGLAAGISDGMSDVVQAAINVCTGAINASKDVLGVHSKSTVFTEIGENMSLGLAYGWEKEFSNFQRTIKDDLDFGKSNVDYSNSGMGYMSAGIVNSLSQTLKSGTQTPINITLMLENGDKLASYLFDPLTEYGRANGRPITGEQYA